MYNTHANFGLHLETKDRQKTEEVVMLNLHKKFMFWIHLKLDDWMIPVEISLHAIAMHETISSTDGLKAT